MRLGSGEACELGEDPEETKVLGAAQEKQSRRV